MAIKRTFSYNDRTFVAYCGFDGRYIVDVTFLELKPNRKIFKYKHFKTTSFLLQDERFSLTEQIRRQLIDIIYQDEQDKKIQKIKENFIKGIDE